MKKLFTLLLLLVSMLSLHAEIRTGKCGNNVTFTLDTETGAMSIEGTGAMSNYSYSALFDSSLNGIGVNLTTAPWRYYYKSLTSVTISEGVTSIGSSAFED